MFSYARAGRSAGVGWELERGRPLAERADASTAAGRAQRGTIREREGAFGNVIITAEVRYSLVTKHYWPLAGGFFIHLVRPADMDGIVFYRTERLESVVEFYVERVGAGVWLEQPDCTILRVGGFRFGFCERDGAETAGILTFVVDSRAEVDDLYADLASVADDDPRYNESYEIYQFFATDPEGRTVEVQTFEHE